MYYVTQAQQKVTPFRVIVKQLIWGIWYVTNARMYTILTLLLPLHS